MQRLHLVFAILALLLTASCKKDPLISNESYISFINATADSTRLIIAVDTVHRSIAPHLSRSLSLAISAGTHRIQLMNAADSTIYIDRATEEFDAGKSYTYIVYDTLTNERLKVFRLTDELNQPAPGSVNIRLLALSPALPAADLTLLQNQLPVTDSITFVNRVYPAIPPDITEASAFTTIPLTNYILRVKLAGTQVQLVPDIFISASSLAGTARINGIATVFITGGVHGKPVVASVFRHYP